MSCTAYNLAGSAVTASVTYTDGISGGVINASLSDAANEDWATIGVKLLKIGLIPQGGAASGAVTIYTADTPAPVVNLAQLDQLSELLGQVSAPAGAYAGAVLTLAGNPGDVVLVSSAEPSPGFPDLDAAAIPSARIQIQGATGSAGGLTVPVTVGFGSTLSVGAGQRLPLDLEFQLAHPAFLVDHRAAGDAAPLWAVNFQGTVRQRPAAGTDLVLRHLYGAVTAAAGDPSALTVTKVYPAWPPVSPETAQASSEHLTLLADATHGTEFQDLDTGTTRTLTDFSSVAGALAGKYLRAAVRYQADGTLVAARLWAGSAFSGVYSGPEGHVLHVDAGAGVLTVADQDGVGVPIRVTPATRFFFRDPANAPADAAPIGSGPAFMGASLVRGFKVHASLDPAASPMTAQTVDIEVARFEGAVSTGAGGFTCTRAFATAADGYTVSLGYGSGFQGAAFDAASGPVDFGGGLPPMLPWATSTAAWNDLANPGGWSARTALLGATGLPVGTVASPWSAGSFGLTLPGGASLVQVDLAASGQVYQVDRTGAALTLTPLGQDGLAAGLAAGARVKVFGVPQDDGRIQASVVFAYTGTAPL